MHLKKGLIFSKVTFILFLSPFMFKILMFHSVLQSSLYGEKNPLLLIINI